jgi:hypothetical protein
MHDLRQSNYEEYEVLVLQLIYHIMGSIFLQFHSLVFSDL